MELETTKDGESNPVQLWSVDMTLEAIDANYVRFDRFLGSRLRLILRRDNRGDIIPYNVSIVIRVYVFWENLMCL